MSSLPPFPPSDEPPATPPGRHCLLVGLAWFAATQFPGLDAAERLCLRIPAAASFLAFLLRRAGIRRKTTLITTIGLLFLVSFFLPGSATGIVIAAFATGTTAYVALTAHGDRRLIGWLAVVIVLGFSVPAAMGSIGFGIAIVVSQALVALISMLGRPRVSIPDAPPVRVSKPTTQTG